MISGRVDVITANKPYELKVRQGCVQPNSQPTGAGQVWLTPTVLKKGIRVSGTTTTVKHNVTSQGQRVARGAVGWGSVAGTVLLRKANRALSSRSGTHNKMASQLKNV